MCTTDRYSLLSFFKGMFLAGDCIVLNIFGVCCPTHTFTRAWRAGGALSHANETGSFFFSFVRCCCCCRQKIKNFTGQNADPPPLPWPVPHLLMDRPLPVFVTFSISSFSFPGLLSSYLVFGTLWNEDGKKGRSRKVFPSFLLLVRKKKKFDFFLK